MTSIFRRCACLGDYDRWCNQKRCSPPENKVNSPSSQDSGGSPQPTHTIRNRGRSLRGHHRRSRRPTGSPSINDQSEDESDRGSNSVSSLNSPTPCTTHRKRRGSKPIRGRHWDDLLVDLDDKPVTRDLASESKVHNAHATAVKSYRDAIQAVGGSASR